MQPRSQDESGDGARTSAIGVYFAQFHPTPRGVYGTDGYTMEIEGPNFFSAREE